MSTENSLPEIHITSTTAFQPAILGWEVYMKDQGKSPYTIKAFVGDIYLLSSYLPPDKNVGDVTTGDLNNFLNWLEKGRGVPCSPKSYARRITSIKAFFRWLHKYGVTNIDPAEKIVQKSVISPLPEVLTPEEEAAVLEIADKMRSAQPPDSRPYTLLKLLLDTGIKKGECLGININHLDLDSPQGPYLFVRYTSSQNRYKERKISLTDEWIAACQEYIAQYQPNEQLFPWSPRRLEYLLEDLSNAAGLKKHLSFDMCRWTSVLNDWRSSMDQDKIRQKLGISKIQWREISAKLRKLAGESASEES
ncbi:MAG: site-specific integrase [Chloroflexi bacterium]|nr:site-specific integrase [Chloroflexota bacterium]